jgi:TRAP-type mannitol/chloroaromatic compound transport system permease large subunit
MGVAALITCALFATATGIVGAVVTLMGLLALPQMLKARYNPASPRASSARAARWAS